MSESEENDPNQDGQDHSTALSRAARMVLREIDSLLQQPLDESPTTGLMRLNSLLFQGIISGTRSALQSPNLSPSTSEDNFRFHFPVNAPVRQRRQIDPHRRFSSEEYSLARDEFKMLCETDTARTSNISTRILNTMIDYYYDHNCDEWPSQLEIITRLKQEPCGCLFLQPIEAVDSSPTMRVIQSCYESYTLRSGDRIGWSTLRSDNLEEEPAETIDDLLFYYVFSEARLPSCDELNPILEYYALHDAFPNLEELQQYVINRLAFYTNPEQYYQQDKVHVPVSHPERIPVVVHQGDPIGCGICQCDITDSQDKIELKGCHHAFHAHIEDCLETASIYTWFQKESYCPMCKSKVSSSVEDLGESS